MDPHPWSYRAMLADLERPDNLQQRAHAAGCPVGDFVYGGHAARCTTLGLTYRDSESQVWKAMVAKARSDSESHAHRTAVLAGHVHCWICVSGIWFTALVQHVVGQVATLVTATELVMSFL